MPVKTIVCTQCGAEVTKRQSRLVDGKRICKSHEEAVEFAETQRKKDLEKALKDRQWKNPRQTRRSHHDYDVFGPEVSPLRRLAAFAMLGKMHREQIEKRQKNDRLAREMMSHSFKATAINVFCDVAMELDLSKKNKLAETTRVILDKKIADILASLEISFEGLIVLKGIAQEATEGMPEDLTERLLSDSQSIHDILDERDAHTKREEELRAELGASIEG